MQRRPSQHSEAPSMLRSSSGSAAGGPAALMSDEELFSTPPDLVCAITQDLLLDPVLNAAGQVYERAAIERHFAASAAPTDPITNMELPSASLVPVFPMRSRAAEYREAAARSAAARAVQAADPLPYLRRAAELLAPSYAAAGAVPAPKVPGMSADFVRYLLAHPGSAYDTLALKFFSNELRRGGYVEEASAVLYRLLVAAKDQQQQAEFLQLCLECWSSSAAAGSSSSTAGSGSGSSSGAGTASSSSGGQPDPQVVAKLADFVRDHEGSMSPAQVLDLLAAACLGRELLLALCEELLGRSGGGPAALPASLAMRYAQISTGQLVEQVAGLQAQLQRVEQQQQAQRANQELKRHEAGGASSIGAGDEAPSASSSGRLALPAKWQPLVRAAATGMLTAASVAGGNHLLLRLARVTPLVFLLHAPRAPPGRRSSQHGSRHRQQHSPASRGQLAAPQHAAAAHVEVVSRAAASKRSVGAASSEAAAAGKIAAGRHEAPAADVAV